MKVEHVRPMKDKLVAKLIHESKVSKGGIITDIKSNGIFSNFAEVLAVGPDVKDSELVVGAQIVIPRSCGVDVTIESEHFLSLQEGEVLAVFTEKFVVGEDLPSDVVSQINS